MANNVYGNTPEEIEAAKAAADAANDEKYDTDYGQWKLDIEREKALPAHLSKLTEVIAQRPSKPKKIPR